MQRLCLASLGLASMSTSRAGVELAHGIPELGERSVGGRSEWLARPTAREVKWRCSVVGSVLDIVRGRADDLPAHESLAAQCQFSKGDACLTRAAVGKRARGTAPTSEFMLRSSANSSAGHCKPRAAQGQNMGRLLGIGI